MYDPMELIPTTMPYQSFKLALAFTVIGAASLSAQGPLRVAPSGRGLTEVTLTLVDSVARASAKPSIIRIDYGQPHLRGRQLLTDSLVPYDKPWRTGANAPTTLTTDVDLVIGGATVPKGRYVLQTLPARRDRKSTRLNSSHLVISYAVFCLKKKKNNSANRTD